MLWSAQETLELIESYLPLPLVRPPAFAPLKTTAGLLPDVMTSYYIECRLAAGQEAVDFLACAAAPAAGGLDCLETDADTAGGSVFPTVFLSDPVWQRIHRFWTQWTNPESVLWGQIPHAWLAFDHAELRRSTPRPCVLFCLDPDYFCKHEDPQHLNRLPGQTYQDVVHSALELLLPAQLPAQQRQRLFACFANLPPEGQIIHVSVMVARTPSAVRLNITVPKHELAAYLQRVQWTGSFDQLEQLLETYCVFPDRIKIQLTIDETIAPRIDFEFHCKSTLYEDSRWQALLDGLVENGLCTPEKHMALHAWPGSVRETFPQAAWPTRFQKWVDLKIIAHGEACLEAKAYLGFMPSASIF